MVADQAASNSKQQTKSPKFPEIVLDTTLAELLAEDSKGDKINESLCNIKPCADPRHKSVPTNRKYLITSTSISDSDDLAHLQLENVSYLLSFWAGHMEVPLVACEGFSNDNTLTKEVIEQNTLRSFSVLNEKQRPWPKVFSNKDNFIAHFKDSKHRVRWGFAVDFSEQVSCFIPAELQYRLNSKRWLGECSLRSANDRLLDPQCSCSEHKTKSGLWYHGSDCRSCEKGVKEEITRIKEILETTKAPYVLKLTQALGSVGTFLVRKEEDKAEAVKQILEIQQTALPKVTESNADIHPVSLILSDFLPGNTNALNFFVHRDGSVRFLGACHQLSTRTTEGGRQHTALTWDHQDELESKFRDTLNGIGEVLHSEGYSGPCGADIMESEDGTQYVIDLNVRTTTSTILGLLKGHCSKRHFNACVVYESLLLSLSRETLEQKFQREFSEGRIILLGNTRLGKKDIWAYPVVIVGEDQDAAKDLGARVLEFESKGRSDAADAGGA